MIQKRKGKKPTNGTICWCGSPVVPLKIYLTLLTAGTQLPKPKLIVQPVKRSLNGFKIKGKTNKIKHRR